MTWPKETACRHRAAIATLAATVASCGPISLGALSDQPESGIPNLDARSAGEVGEAEGPTNDATTERAATTDASLNERGDASADGDTRGEAAVRKDASADDSNDGDARADTGAGASAVTDADAAVADGADARADGADAGAEGGDARADAADAPPDAVIDVTTSDGGGRLDASADGDGLLRPGRPPELRAWEPPVTDPAAQVSAIARQTVGPITCVGFTNGELYLTFNENVAVPTWTRIDKPAQPNALSLPYAAITSIVVDELSPPRIFVGFSGAVSGRKLWSAGNAFIFSDLPMYEDVIAISLDPWDLARIFVHTTGTDQLSEDGGQSFHPGALTVTGLALDSDERVTVLSGSRSSPPPGAWVGTSKGRIYLSANLDDPLPGWIPRFNSNMPQRAVTGIVANDHFEVWATFAELNNDNVWYSQDTGARWSARYNFDLPPVSALDSNRHALGPALIPFYGALYVGITETSPGALISHWTTDRGLTWSNR